MQRRPRIAFYGDDFTGSTDAMECLASAGLRTVLFVDVPDSAVAARFVGLEAVGIAGNSRTLTPEEMDAAMPPVFAALARLGAPILHYKTCSTFDSSPSVGSIGHVMDLARHAFGATPFPIVVGAPKLGRYCVFGNLFARHNVDGVVHRLDRHPTMSVHPTTPMREADLRKHLAAQTRQSIALLTIVQAADSVAAAKAALAKLLDQKPDAVLIDLSDEAGEATVGALIGAMVRTDGPLFTIGSSGVEYALTAAWTTEGSLPAARPRLTAGPVDRLLVVSGSCSPTTGAQIASAVRTGFAEAALDPVALIREGADGPHGEQILERATETLGQGRSLVVHSSTGPDDPRERQVVDHYKAAGVTADLGRIKGGRALANALGTLLSRLLERVALDRFVVAGGDTSSASIKLLGIDALEMVAPLAPGAPLCRALAPGRPLHGRELVLKGGQIGGPDFFVQVRAGRL
jgi:3-oxoisoapionate kinase